MAYTVCKEEQKKIESVVKQKKNEVRTYHRGSFHRPSQSVYCTCGDQWAGGNGSCKEYRQVQGIFGPGYTKACFY